MNIKNQLLAIFFIAFIFSCSKVPISNRKQMHLLNEQDLIQMAELQYNDFMKSAEVLPANNAQAIKIKKIGKKYFTLVDTKVEYCCHKLCFVVEKINLVIANKYE